MASYAPQNLHSVFVYRSLLAFEVVAALLNRVPQSSTAVLHNLLVYPFTLPLVFSFGFWTSDFSILILVFSSFNFAFHIAVVGYCCFLFFCKKCKSHIPHWLWSGFSSHFLFIKGVSPSSLNYTSPHPLKSICSITQLFWVFTFCLNFLGN